MSLKSMRHCPASVQIRHEDCDKLRVSPTHRNMQIGASRGRTVENELDVLRRR